MNNILKGLLIFLGGAAVGGGATYAIVNSINEANKDKEISERVMAITDIYRNTHSVSINQNSNSVDQIKDTLEGIEETTRLVKDAGYATVSVDDIPEPEPEEEDDEEEEKVVERHNAFDDAKSINEEDISEEEEDDVIEKGSNSNGPYIISPDEFQNDYVNDYEKTSLIFFKDNILTDDEYVEINPKDSEKLLGGPKLFTAFGSKGAKKDVVYIRNDLHHTDYEIFHSSRKYVTEVLHMEDEDEE